MVHGKRLTFFCPHCVPVRAETLGASDPRETQRLLNAKNQAFEQPHLNVAMERVYLSCKSPEMLERTWNEVTEEMELSYLGPTLKRWRTQMKSASFQVLRKLKLLETTKRALFDQHISPRLEALPAIRTAAKLAVPGRCGILT